MAFRLSEQDASVGGIQEDMGSNPGTLNGFWTTAIENGWIVKVAK